MNTRILDSVYNSVTNTELKGRLTSSILAEDEEATDADATESAMDSTCSDSASSADEATLEEGISLARRSIALCEVSDPDRAEKFQVLATLLWRRQMETGEDALLAERIEIEKQVCEMYRDNDHEKCAVSCRSVAFALRALYEATGRESMLDEAISFEREELSLKPDYPGRASLCSLFSQSLIERFDMTGDESLLNEAITFEREALSLCPDGHPHRAPACASLAFSLQTRFERSGEQAELDESIELLRETLSLTSVSPVSCDRALKYGILALGNGEHFGEIGSDETWMDRCIDAGEDTSNFSNEDRLDRADVCANLAFSLTERFKLSGDESNFHEAVVLLREAVALRPIGHPRRASACGALADQLKIGLDRIGDETLLDEVIALGREAVSLMSEDDYTRLTCYISLSHSLMMRFKLTGDATLLQEAIILQRNVLALTPSDDPDRREASASLAILLKVLFGHTRDLKLLDEAIIIERGALNEAVGHSARQHACANLAATLSMLYPHAKDITIFWEAKKYYDEALSLVPEGHAEQMRLWGNLSAALQLNFEVAGDEESLDQAILLERKVLAKMSFGHSGRADQCLRLAKAMITCSSHKRDYMLVEESVELLHEVLAARPQGHLSRWEALIDLIKVHLNKETPRYDLAKAMGYLHEVTTPSANNLPNLLSQLAKVLNMIDLTDVQPSLQSSLLQCYSAAIDLSSLVAGFVLDRDLQLRYLLDCQNLGPQAFLSANIAGEKATGLMLLERARGIMWSQALHVRDPQLQDAPPALASELENLLQRVSTEKPADRISSQITDTTEQSWLTDRDVRHRYGSRIQELITQIRASPGQENFMRGPSFGELVQIAAKHPVVILVAVQREYHALILPSDDEPMAVLELEDIGPGELTRLSVSAFAVNLRGGVPEGDSDEQRGMNVSSKKRSYSLLARLWTTIVKPVIDFLQVKKATGRHRPRIHWCPTGAFAFLPLHAAGIYEAGGLDCCSDYVVSSYTPTLTALLRAQRAAPSLNKDKTKLVLVAAMKSHNINLPMLWNVEEEMNYVENAAEQVHIPVSRDCGESAATVKRVAACLESATFAHIACHGIQDPQDALSSGFYLSDGSLTVAKLMELDLKSAFFAFLSACETAKGDSKQPDQTVHLAAAMLFVGFRSVVATMWAMNDADGPGIAKLFYEKLFSEDVITVDSIPYALDHAVSELRASGVPPERWAPFVHIGA